MAHFKEDDLLLRTTLESFANGHVCLQAYAGSDLILESQMPDYFTLLRIQTDITMALEYFR